MFKLNKFEYAFMISYLKKAIYNLERARYFDENAVSLELINQLKETLILYQHNKETYDE